MLKRLLALAISLAVGSAAAATPTLFERVGTAGAIASGKAYAVTLNRDAVEAAIIEGNLWIPLPGNQVVLAKTVSHQFLRDGNLNWTGTVRTKAGDRTVLITMGRDAVFGSLIAEDGSPLQLESRNGVTRLVAEDPKFDTLFRPGKQHTPDFVLVEPVKPTKADLDKTRQALALATAPVVDVFVGYTQGLVTRYGSEAAAITRLNYIVSRTNQAFTDSQVDATLRLVGTLKVNYADTETNSAALNALGDKSGTGPLQVLRDARRDSGADMLAIVRPFLTPEHGNCGLASVNGSNLSAYTTAAASSANSAISDGKDDNSGYFCADTTFAHELGHNWGQVHDSANSSTPGPYPYTYGWRQTLPTGGFHTLMAYGADGQVLAPYYSNPNITLCSGYPCGDAATADQARALRQVLPVAAAFNQPLDPNIDLNGDGAADMLYEKDGAITYVLYNSGSPQGSGAQTIGVGYTISAVGDFNGDHRTDIVWINASRQQQFWFSQLNGTFSQTAGGSYISAWTAIGSGDLSGDGKSDIVFINPGTQKVRYWVMNGATNTSNKIFDMPVGYRVIGIKDYDGDGRVDLMWANADRKLQFWKNNGNNTFTIDVNGPTYDEGRRIVGSGDFNNDQKADLVFYNDGALLLAPAEIWLMNGVNRIGAQSVAGPVLSLLHNLATVDRYSGGTSSVMWTSTLRDLYLSQNNGSGDDYTLKGPLLVWPSGSPGSYYRNYDAGWRIVTGEPPA